MVREFVRSRKVRIAIAVLIVVLQVFTFIVLCNYLAIQIFQKIHDYVLFEYHAKVFNEIINYTYTTIALTVVISVFTTLFVMFIVNPTLLTSRINLSFDYVRDMLDTMSKQGYSIYNEFCDLSRARQIVLTSIKRVKRGE